ncbi:uncharacterized protein ACBR49_005616 isoform 2-T2 [Aulostomus maculatus]
MKVQLLLPLTIAMSVALVVILKTRKHEQDQEERRNRFESMRLRVTHDVLGEYQGEKIESENLLLKADTEQKVEEEDMKKLETKIADKKWEADICQGSQKPIKDETATAEKELNDLKGETSKEKNGWTAEIKSLTDQLAALSPVCAHLKPGSEMASKLCSSGQAAEAPKQEEPKAEAAQPEPPKPQEPNAEAPKPEEPKVEAPKPEEPKAEAPQPQAPQAEAPKAEAPQPEAPKA